MYSLNSQTDRNLMFICFMIQWYIFDVDVDASEVKNKIVENIKKKFLVFSVKSSY